MMSPRAVWSVLFISLGLGITLVMLFPVEGNTALASAILAIPVVILCFPRKARADANNDTAYARLPSEPTAEERGEASAATPPTAAAAARPPRLHFLDNLKSALTAIVVTHHVTCAFIATGEVRWGFGQRCRDDAPSRETLFAFRVTRRRQLASHQWEIRRDSRAKSSLSLCVRSIVDRPTSAPSDGGRGRTSNPSSGV